MSKSEMSSEEKKPDEGGGDPKSPVPDVVTRLTRNRLLQHQRQKTSSSVDGGLNDPKSGKFKTKPQEDGDKDRLSSLDNEKEPNNNQPEPQQLLDPSKTENTSVSIMKPRRAKKSTATKESKNGISEKNVFAMKTRSSRSCNQPVANMSATTQQNKGKEGNGNARRKKKGNSSSYKRSKRMYDEAGTLITNGMDYCDCLEVDCPGCHFPCKKCGSEKCGTECRCDRTWVYDEVKIEGTGILIKNQDY